MDNQLINKLGFTEEVIIAPKESKDYLDNLWSKDYGMGLYFSAFHELDNYLYIHIIISGQLHLALHSICDGFSILKKINTTKNLGIELPDNQAREKPKFLKWLSCIYKAMSGPKAQKMDFLLPRSDISDPQESSFFSIQVNEDQIKNNTTSFILNKVSKICSNNFIKNNSSRWMIPVNLRGQTKPSPKSELCSSYVGIITSNNDSPIDTKHKLIKKLKDKEYWFFWLASQVGIFFGKSLIMYLTKLSLKNKSLSWLGCFSSLGDIGGNGEQDFVIIAPVRYHRPIGVIYYKYNLKYHIVVSVHKSVKPKIQMDDLKDEIFKSITK